MVEADGTAEDIDGRKIFFSFQRFKDEICKKGYCFVCGAAPNKSFNNEHIIPNWALRHCGMHQETLTLPTGNRVKYGTYKIPCCKDCNSRLSEIYETPVSKAICGGYESLITYLKEGGSSLIRAWLALIFLKVHLRDFKNRISLDKRQELGVIGDEYELSDLHHIHAIARAETAGIEIDDRVFGTLMILKIDPSLGGDPFDYCDNLAGRTLLIQIYDIALIYVIDDCGATAGMLSEQLKSMPNPISEIQLREVYARHLAANIHIKKRPTFRTELVGHGGHPRITVTLPNFEIHPFEPSIFGRVLVGALGNLTEGIVVDGKTGSAALDIVATGRVSFLFDETGAVRRSTTTDKATA
ncbi:hypothetical protein ACFSQQ_04555 [Mesorhizobium kowhaii]|uniref:hypothetical protein n=1 Tax=Mesorhizobium kowhaii TaxID=1300272 RepID=UPI0035E827A2